ncbi:hypothetical protein GCM10027596_11970 [Nocardioides korecus]
MPLLVPAVAALALSAVAVTGVNQLTPTADHSSSTAGSAAARKHADAVPGGRLVRHWYAGLDTTQKTCLARHDVTTHPGPATAADRLALLRQVSAAAKACDVAFPQAARAERRLAFWVSLSAEQRACLQKASVERPIGPATAAQRKAERQQLRREAAACGVTLPRHRAARGAGATTAG